MGRFHEQNPEDHRRIHALYKLGWSKHSISIKIGISDCLVHKMLKIQPKEENKNG